MLVSYSDLKGVEIQATDGRIGAIDDAYFDDRDWVTRYLIADTGKWLPGRQVLLSPVSLRRLDLDARLALFDLTRVQVENSPGIEADQPVSRQHEMALVGYYPWPAYWSVPSPAFYRRSRVEQEGDPHLRSAREVQGYYIGARDGDLGHVEDFLIDQTWQIRYLVVDTRNWWPGKKVLVAPEWVREVDWEQSKVHVDLTRDQIRNSPEYHYDRPVSQDYEERLYAHYQRTNSRERSTH